MNRLIASTSLAFLLAACDSSRSPIGPTLPPAIPQPTSTPPSVNRAEPGPRPITGTAVAPGTTIDVTIQQTDPACFPNWDSSGRCRQFDVAMPADGTLVATLTYPGPSRGDWNPDVFIAAPDGQWVPPDFGWPDRQVRSPAKQGMTYRVVVLSYGPFPDAVQLMVDVHE